jgi:hypothetical protein
MCISQTMRCTERYHKECTVEYVHDATMIPVHVQKGVIMFDCFVSSLRMRFGHETNRLRAALLCPFSLGAPSIRLADPRDKGRVAVDQATEIRLQQQNQQHVG